MVARTLRPEAEDSRRISVHREGAVEISVHDSAKLFSVGGLQPDKNSSHHKEDLSTSSVNDHQTEQRRQPEKEEAENALGKVDDRSIDQLREEYSQLPPGVSRGSVEEVLGAMRQSEAAPSFAQSQGQVHQHLSVHVGESAKEFAKAIRTLIASENARDIDAAQLENIVSASPSLENMSGVKKDLNDAREPKRMERSTSIDSPKAWPRISKPIDPA
eukprot:CAMPEP_0169410924 /NCGR_PEP_ID=MMETSP1017-20121227/60029_1 /TAXON_ID=342587 /ORGANISM="Karlodinium micrum, Strain CCMP2283" /LENGTH=215 /DNA_ID=CAMNT_0009518199 /DNA_START=88 /DNA_END=735 /DNA_ORIENTATION=+